MIDENLVEELLIAPARAGGNKLTILSGYATPEMVSQHFNMFLRKLPGERRKNMEVQLVYGMSGIDGVPTRAHAGFVELSENLVDGRFSCFYVRRQKSFHDKIYLWWRDGRPWRAWTGSANYTQNGFGIGNRSAMHHESVVEIDPDVARTIIDKACSDSISANSEEIENHVDFYLEPPGRAESLAVATRIEPVDSDFSLFDKVELPLFSVKENRIHDSSGLNWGQRTVNGVKREPNQAYIPVPAGVAKSDFFPAIGVHFTLLLPGGESMIVTRAQQGGKAIECPANNSRIGQYFRNRLGIPSGAFVELEDLDHFGARFATIYKLDDGTYALDYTSPRP